MVHVLGINLEGKYLMRHAFTKIYGIGPQMAHRLCARFQIHDRTRVRDLTQFQITAITSFLSSPSTALRLPHYPLATADFEPSGKPIRELQADFNAERTALQQRQELRQQKRLKHGGNSQSSEKLERDPLYGLKIESELRREIRENVAHLKMIGSYAGRRHAMHLPVRGQRTRNNTKTARRCNRL